MDGRAVRPAAHRAASRAATAWVQIGRGRTCERTPLPVARGRATAAAARPSSAQSPDALGRPCRPRAGPVVGSAPRAPILRKAAPRVCARRPDTLQGGRRWPGKTQIFLFSRRLSPVASWQLGSTRVFVSRFPQRWRTDRELFDGKGQFTCGNKVCTETDGLQSFELHFSYEELGERKQALVKVRACPACAAKMDYRKRKDERRAARREERQTKRRQRREERRRAKADGSSGRKRRRESDGESEEEEEEAEAAHERPSADPPPARAATAAAAAASSTSVAAHDDDSLFERYCAELIQ